MGKYAAEIITAVVFAVLFAASSILSHHTASLVVPAAAIGAFFAIVGLPMIDAKKWKESALRDVVAGAMAGIVIAFWADAPLEGYITAILLGILLGFVAPLIVRHVQLP